MKFKRLSLWFWGFVFALAGIGCENVYGGAEELENSNIRKVHNGTVVYENDEAWNAINRAVGGIVTYENSHHASGTGLLIAPRLLLTGKHCGLGEGVRFGVDASQGYEQVGVSEQIEHDVPGDIAVHVLAHPPKTAIPYWKPSRPGGFFPDIRSGITIFGFGSQFSNPDGPLRKTDCVGEFDYEEAAGWLIKSDCGDAGSEKGDSGGPVLNSQMEIVGTTWGSRSTDDTVSSALMRGQVSWIEARIDEYRTKLIVGDYDGQGGEDFLFWNDKGKGSWVDLSGTTGLDYEADDTLGGWCDADLRTGDFNGDGELDLFCYRDSDKRFWIDYSDNGRFDGTDVTRVYDWCDRELLVGDFNGDGYSDLYCRDTNSWRRVDLNSKSSWAPFGTTNWEAQNGWCGSTGDHLVGDFNGDGRDDLLCYVPDSAMYIKYATEAGNFSAGHRSKNTNWCGTVAELYVGDLDGDDVSDLFCWNADENKMYVDYGISTTGFPFQGTDWQDLDTNWCWEEVAQLTIGDVNGDGKDDLVCSRADTGETYVDYAGEKWGKIFNGQNDKTLPRLTASAPQDGGDEGDTDVFIPVK